MTAKIPVGFSLGSNIGDKAGTMLRALALLDERGAASDMAVSSLYRTAPWGHVVEQDWFVNACAIGWTHLAPDALLQCCKAIEADLGRTATVRWGPRLIDIDILFYGSLAIETPELTLPHKEILNRAFVLVPLAELCPDRLIGSVTVAEAAEALGDAGIQRLAAFA